MGVVIIGGNECMVRQYKDLCCEYRCDVKIFPKTEGGLRKKIGRPDLLVLFTDTMSHKLVRSALEGVKGLDTIIARSHTSSMAALKNILERHAVGESHA